MKRYSNETRPPTIPGCEPAIAWLEEAGLLNRHENRVQVFPSSLKVNSVEEARAKLDRKDMADVYHRKLLTIAETLIDADADEGISTDELMGMSGLSAEGRARCPVRPGAAGHCQQRYGADRLRARGGRAQFAEAL